VVPPELLPRFKASVDFVISKLTKGKSSKEKIDLESFYSDSQEEELKGEEGVFGKKGFLELRRMQYKEIKFGKESDI